MIGLYFNEKKVEILYCARHGIVAHAGTGEQPIRVSLKSAQRAHDALESLHAKVQVVIKYWQTLFDTP